MHAGYKSFSQSSTKNLLCLFLKESNHFVKITFDSDYVTQSAVFTRAWNVGGTRGGEGRGGQGRAGRAGEGRAGEGRGGKGRDFVHNSLFTMKYLTLRLGHHHMRSRWLLHQSSRWLWIWKWQSTPVSLVKFISDGGPMRVSPVLHWEDISAHSHAWNVGGTRASKSHLLKVVLNFWRKQL